MNYQFVTIEGNIGVGKTSLAKRLSVDYNAELVLEEFENNPFLPEFYRDPDKNAFPLELFFMAERYQQLLTILQKELFQQSVIADYLFSKSQIFAKNNLDEAEFDLFMRLYRFLENQLPQPDLIIYLHSSIGHLQKNIKKRGRSYELEIGDDYLADIEQAYFNYFKIIKNKLPILVIKADSLDFVSRGIDYTYIKNLLEKPYSNGIHII